MAAAVTYLDLTFPVLGQTIPIDHGYALYSAVSRLAPVLHGAKEIGIFSIRGTPAGGRLIACGRTSMLRFRLPAERIPIILPLAGKSLVLSGHQIRLGVPQVQALTPADVLHAPLVVLKFNRARDGSGRPAITAEGFLELARKKLTGAVDENPHRSGLGFSNGLKLSIPAARNGRKPGEPARRVIRVKDNTEVGYALIVSGLSPAESLSLQDHGLGGRRLMGCGLFLPYREG